MNPNVRQSWENFLNPEVLRTRLVAASVYIAGYELLKDSIVDRIRDFFCFGFDENGDIIDPTYEADVLSRNRSPLHASLLWLKERNAINDTDMAAFDRVKVCRNHLAHQLLKVVSTEGLPADFMECFIEMARLTRKIGLWWVKNVDILTNPDFDGKDIDDEEIIPGAAIGLQLLWNVALGDDEQSRFYYEEFTKQTNPR